MIMFVPILFCDIFRKLLLIITDYTKLQICDWATSFITFFDKISGPEKYRLKLEFVA